LGFCNCSTQFSDGATWLLNRKENDRVYQAMFTFMNTADRQPRWQGVLFMLEAALSRVLSREPKDRQSMRALSGKKQPESVADCD